tara:strand:+ start:456 stop:1076 length:621 start_codon:yes stop_codon:yes gene_type:complete
MIVIDIGACIGLFIEDCLMQYKNIEKIYAIEPLKANYEFLVSKYGENERIEIINAAVSNFDGRANFYKKFYGPKNNMARGFDFAGNAGSSLKQDKTNVTGVCEEISVVKLSSFFKHKEIKKVDLLKIDTEGSEYDIINDILDNQLHETIDKIYYEDHCRKVPSIIDDQENTVMRIKQLNIGDKFFIQQPPHHLVYEPFKKIFCLAG